MTVQRWVVCFLVAAAILGIAALSYAGVCFGTWRFLTDDEAVDAAIDDVLILSLHAVELPRGDFMRFRPEKPVSYKSRDEFRRVNPDCCTVVPHDAVRVGFHRQLFGCAAKSVHVRYMVRYINEFGSVSSMEAQAQRAIANCGHVLNTGH